jgi:hypothetical protein
VAATRHVSVVLFLRPLCLAWTAALGGCRPSLGNEFHRMINLPLVFDARAGRWTARTVERELTKKPGAKYLQTPQVTSLIKGSEAKDQR